MTEDEATQQADRLCELFNDATPEKCVLLRRRFLYYDQDVVSKSIGEYATQHKFLDVAPLLAMVKDEIRRRRGDDNAARRKQEQDDFLRDERAVDESLAGLTDDELDEYKAAILGSEPVAGWPQRMRQRLESGDPRTNPLLRSLIVQRLGVLTCA